MGELTGQTAIVTGASSGIGEGIARAYAREGARVVVNALASGLAAARKIVAEMESAGGSALAIACDVSNEADVERMFAETIAAYGTVDILVANAGRQKDAAFVDMTLDDWNATLSVDLTGQFLCARSAVREYLRRGMVPERSKALGKIVCMSSVHQRIAWAGHVNYAAAKGGVKMFMESLAQEVAPHRIRVNAIAPGAIETEINQAAWGTPAALEKLLKLIPYGRPGVTDDIASAAIWLASDASDYVVGTTLFVDGGMSLYPGFAHGG